MCAVLSRDNIDLNTLPDTDVELKKVPFSGRVSPTDVPDFLMKKLDAVLASDDLSTPAEEFDANEDQSEDLF